MKKETSFTPKQISDAEQLLNELTKIPENKRPFIVSVITAYMKRHRNRNPHTHK